MSGVRLRPRSLFSSTPFSSLSRHLSSIISHHISSRFVLIVVTVLPLSLAALGFFLQLGSGGGGGVFNEFIDQQQYELLRKLQRNSSVELKCNRNNVVDRNLTFPYFKEWRFWFNGNGSDQERLEQSQTKICITTSTSAGLEQVLPWIMYHKLIGISHFFIFVEGKAASPTVGGVLETIPGVKVVYRTPELEELQMKSRIWNETWLEDFFYKPCNYELFVKQNLNMEMGIVMAREAGMEWIFHLDTDELVYPAGTLDYSVTTLLADIPEPVHVVIFSNYETAVERDDIKEPFGEISLFKKSYDHLTHEIYNQTYDDATRGNPNYFLTYGNGKSAARIRDTLRPNGAHRWYSYDNNQNEMEFTEAAVLHYTYSKFSDLTSRRDRCNCKPTQEDLERCFMLEFDRNAFIVASTSTEEEMLQWYNDHVVWRDINLKKKLLKNSVLTRIYTPMVMIQTLKESGVFTSIIESANKLMMNNKTSQSEEEEEEDEGSKRSRTVSFLADPKPSHDDDDAGKFRVEPRRSDVSRAAVPPLSPPTLEELSLRNNKLGIHRQGLR